jgi:RNA methyltransferase, TrmH family
MDTPPLLSENKQKLLRKAHQKKYRDQLDLYFGEGYRLLTAAFTDPATKILEIILGDRVLQNEQGSFILRSATDRKIPVYRSTERQMRLLSDEVTPPGIFFTVAKRPGSSHDLRTSSEPILVFLEQIADAGNLGTILRSMVWFGIKSLVLSPGCVDAYNPKSVRASAGAIFTANIYANFTLAEVVNLLKPQGYLIMAAVPDGGQAITAGNPENKILLVFGSEATGLTESTLKLVDRRITIPAKGKLESLNLAVSAGIMFYQITKR